MKGPGRLTEEASSESGTRSTRTRRAASRRPRAARCNPRGSPAIGLGQERQAASGRSRTVGSEDEGLLELGHMPSLQRAGPLNGRGRRRGHRATGRPAASKKGRDLRHGRARRLWKSAPKGPATCAPCATRANGGSRRSRGFHRGRQQARQSRACPDVRPLTAKKSSSRPSQPQACERHQGRLRLAPRRTSPGDCGSGDGSVCNRRATPGRARSNSRSTSSKP